MAQTIDARSQVEQLVRGCTTSMAEDKMIAVINYIVDARAKGTNSSVWHATAQVFRNGTNCQCAECRPA